MQPGTLYVVATPIGNLEDITLRAVRVLREVDAIACEDTRISARLLDHYGIRKRCISYYYPRERSKMEAILELLREGKSIALITDSGTPGVSDPGAVLVNEAHARGMRVEPVPGPCAAVAAVSVSGFEHDGFLFAGFLKEGGPAARRRELDELARAGRPVVLYVAPHDVRHRIDEIIRSFGDRRVLVAREVTKRFEEIRRTTLGELVGALPSSPRGEYVLVIEPGDAPPPAGEMSIADRYEQLVAGGLTRAQAIKTLSQETSQSKRQIVEKLGER